MVMMTFWFVHKCPLSEECSAQSWARQKRCWSYIGPDIVKEHLRTHLTTSALHMGRDDACIDEILEKTEVYSDECEDDDEVEGSPAPSTPPGGPRQPKSPIGKRKAEGKGSWASQSRRQAPAAGATAIGAPKPGKGGQGGVGKGNKGGGIDMAMVGTIAAQAAAEVVALTAKHGKDQVAASSSSSSGSGGVVLASGDVLVRKVVLKRVQDAVDRAAAAAKHAVAISQAASKAFSEEHDRLTECSIELGKVFSTL